MSLFKSHSWNSSEPGLCLECRAEFGCDALKSRILVQVTEKGLNPGRNSAESRSWSSHRQHAGIE